MILQVLANSAIPDVIPAVGYGLFIGSLLVIAGIIKWITGSMAPDK